MLTNKTRHLVVCSVLLILSLSSGSFAQKEKDKEKKEYTGTPVMWTEPTDISSRNLLLGAGGEQMRPDIQQDRDLDVDLPRTER